MQDEREVTVELERERRGTEVAPIRLAPDDLEPDTLRAVIESFVLREGTDYGVHETSLEDKVAQVLIQLRRGEAHITFDPATESVNVVVTSAPSANGIGLCQMRTSALLLMLGACASQAHGQTAAAPSPSDAYVAVVSTYAAQPAQAVRALSQWRTSDVERALEQIPRTTAGSIVLTGGDGAERMLERMALLHAETALTHYERDDTDAMRAHLEWSRRIVHHDLPWPTPGDTPGFVVNPKFVSDWALTIVGFFQTKLAFSEARRFLDQELKTGSWTAHGCCSRGG